MTENEWDKVISYLLNHAGDVHKLYHKSAGWIKLSFKDHRATITELDRFNDAIRIIDFFIKYHK